MLLLAGGCDLLGEDESGDPTPSVGSVEQVQLQDEASTSDFGTLTSSHALPADKTEALALGVIGLAQIMDHLDTELSAGWEPTGESTFTLRPEELLSGELTELPPEIVLEAALKNEILGNLTADAQADADVSISWNADDLPTRIRGAATGSMDAQIDPAIEGTNTNVQGGSMHAALDVAVDVIIDGWRTVDGEDLPSSVNAAAAMSLKLSSAMSVETTGETDSPITEPRAAHLLISGELSAGQTLSITQEMIDDPQLLSEYLEEELQEPEFTMTVEVYDSAGSLETTYSYDAAYFAQLVEEEQR